MNFLLDRENKLFELARSGQRLPHILLTIVLAFAFVLAAQLTGGLLALLIILLLSSGESAPLSQDDPNAIVNALMPDTALEQTILLVLAFGPIFIFIWAWLAFVEKRPLWTIGMERSDALWKYGRGLLVGFLMFLAAVGISAALGYVAFETGDPQKQGLSALGGVLLVFLGWTVQGPAEEALTRGWVLPVIGARYRPWLGVLISSLIFAILHSLNPNLSLIAILNLFLFGLFTALYALYEESMWGVFSIHAVWNWIQGNMLGFEVSGSLAPGGTLFDLQEVGPDVITGGSFGPEGGLAVTLVLLASIAIVVLLAQRRANTAPG